MRKNSKNFAVIGIGSFGLAVARTLIDRDKSVIAIDKNPQRLRELEESNASLYLVEDITKKSLLETGLKDADIAIIGIGTNIEASILSTLFCQEMGISRVIAKAISEDHANILRRLGAEVVYPEVDEGTRLAMTLASRFAENILPISDEFMILEIIVPESLTGKTIIELDTRRKYGVNIIAISKDGKTSANIAPDTVIERGDALFICGANDGLDKLQKEYNRL